MHIGKSLTRAGPPPTSRSDADLASLQQSIERSLTNLSAEGRPKSVSEEALFAGVLMARIEATAGSEIASRFRTVFTLERNALAEEQQAPSAERAAIRAIKYLRQTGDITGDTAGALRDEAFQSAQLDDNNRKLFDHIGSIADKTRTVARTAKAAYAAATKILQPNSRNR